MTAHRPCSRALVICEGHGGVLHSSTAEKKAGDALWHARMAPFWSAHELRAEAAVLITDVAVPISRLAECIEATRVDIEDSGLLCPVVGHVGDGARGATRRRRRGRCGGGG